MTHRERVKAIREQMKRALAACDMATYSAKLEELSLVLMREAQS